MRIRLCWTEFEWPRGRGFYRFPGPRQLPGAGWGPVRISMMLTMRKVTLPLICNTARTKAAKPVSALAVAPFPYLGVYPIPLPGSLDYLFEICLRPAEVRHEGERAAHAEPRTPLLLQTEKDWIEPTGGASRPLACVLLSHERLPWCLSSQSQPSGTLRNMASRPETMASSAVTLDGSSSVPALRALKATARSSEQKDMRGQESHRRYK